MASQAGEDLLSFAKVLEGLVSTGMWSLEFDEDSEQWTLKALKGPNKGRCLFTAPKATPIRLNRET